MQIECFSRISNADNMNYKSKVVNLVFRLSSLEDGSKDIASLSHLWLIEV